MSVELYVFSKRPVIERQTLASDCLWPAFPPRLKWELRFLRESHGLDLLGKGPLSTGVVLGWQPGAKMATQIVDAIARCSLADVERLTRKNAIASLGVSVIGKTDALDWRGHTNLGALEAVPKEFHRFIHDSVSLYVLETSATRNKLSLKFQEYLWRMLETLTYGLAINPQTGECDLFPDKRT